MNNEEIKTIQDMKEWELIKQLFEEETKNILDTSTIRETLSPDHIKTEVIARNIASKMIKKVINRILKATSEINPKKKVYR